MNTELFNIGDLVELTVNTFCPIFAEEAAHEAVTADAVAHKRGSALIHTHDVLKVVKAADANHLLLRVDGLLVCVSRQHLKRSEVRLS